ncbi:transcriptional regulator [Streptomyces roseicoloratus]|uniref:transcriptional regulator n=1 Tax=Streptomyces roseicoloratus TaxID=2508722 RepID=UPI001CA5024B|nr:transcriptional regulator [Streptomyces roseicoloratus]
MTTGETAPDPRGARNPAEFVARLQELKNRSGLTFRELTARAAAHGDVLPRSTVANMLARTTLPRPELLTAFVRACGVDPAAEADWQAVRKELAEPATHGAEAAGGPSGAAEAAGGRPADGAEGACGAADGAEGTPGEREAPEATGPLAEADAADPAGGAEALVWPGAELAAEAGEAAEPPTGGDAGPAPDPRIRLRRTLVGAVGVAALVLAAVSVVAFVREDDPAHGRGQERTGAPASATTPDPAPATTPGPTRVPPPVLTAPAEGPVHIRVVGSGLCLGERRGSGSGRIHQRDCAGADVPRYALKRLPRDEWRIVSDHPDYGPGCSGIPSGGRIPDAAFEDSECGDPGRVERFTLEPYGSPVRGYRIVPAGSATSGGCVTVTGDRTAAWSRLAQAPCAADAAGQLFSFDRR